MKLRDIIKEIKIIRQISAHYLTKEEFIQWGLQGVSERTKKHRLEWLEETFDTRRPIMLDDFEVCCTLYPYTPEKYTPMIDQRKRKLIKTITQYLISKGIPFIDPDFTYEILIPKKYIKIK